MPCQSSWVGRICNSEQSDAMTSFPTSSKTVSKQDETTKSAMIDDNVRWIVGLATTRNSSISYLQLITEIIQKTACAISI